MFFVLVITRPDNQSLPDTVSSKTFMWQKETLLSIKE